MKKVRQTKKSESRKTDNVEKAQNNPSSDFKVKLPKMTE
jgi:hypothetical protein